MNRKSLMIIAGISSLTLATLTTSVLAVSEETRMACEAKAEQVRPALRADEKEAFIANCLANATAR